MFSEFLKLTKQTVLSLMHNLTRPVHFDDHIATVQSYLDAYKAALKLTQDKMSVIFWGYLTAACWKKLPSQMDHWLIEGIITPHDTCSTRKNSD